MDQEIYAAALKMLLRKNYFTEELAAKLKGKFPDGDIDPVIEKIKLDKYLDDDRLFKNYVIWKTESGYGPYYIREKLRIKGLNKSVDDIKEVLDDEEVDLDAVIEAVFDKYRRTARKKSAEAMRRSCYTYLTGKGFSASDSLRIINKEVSKDESDFFEGC